jgi:hypothetical protein
MLEEVDLSDDHVRALRHEQSKWSLRTVLTFEGVLWLVVLALMALSWAAHVS